MPNQVEIEVIAVANAAGRFLVRRTQTTDGVTTITLEVCASQAAALQRAGELLFPLPRPAATAEGRLGYGSPR